MSGEEGRSQSGRIKIWLVLASNLSAVLLLSVGAFVWGYKEKTGAWWACRECYSTAQAYQRLLFGYELPPRLKTTFESQHFSGCAHRWEEGLPLVNPTRIDNGQVILLYAEGCYGAFVPHQQRVGMTTDQFIEYDWYWRDDGSGMLDPDNSAVKSGDGKTNRTIKFGPFEVDWYPAGMGRGRLIYDLRPGPVARYKTPLYMCVTNARDITSIDATLPRWTYKASLSDPGWSPPNEPGATE